jgi:hypothetical protein
MPKFTIEWESGKFATDCDHMAASFMRSPDCFIPGSSSCITDNVRGALTGFLSLNGHATSNQIDVDGVRITFNPPGKH